ncbi:MAG TPA: MBL fold metallo-hydrolase [Flavitalea sp.]|nr:MBL fold metallo-hydrolase [Flavitalea sp.]
MQLYTIDTGYFKLDGGAMFGVVPKSIWNRLQPADSNNLCTWAMRCLLIEDGKKLTLIDTGIGDKQDEKFFSHYYLHGDASLKNSLAVHGFTPDDITDVFLTHLHFDHVGGSIIREKGKLVPAFKNAIYWSNDSHWKHAMAPNPREKASFLHENIVPVMESGQLQFAGPQVFQNKTDLGWEANLSSEPPFIYFTDDIKIRLVNGHTQSMMLPQIRYKEKTIVYMADLLPSTSHLPMPYVMGYDIDPLRTMIEKDSFLKEALEKDFILFFEHDPKHECCTLRKTEKGIRESAVFKLSEI